MAFSYVQPRHMVVLTVTLSIHLARPLSASKDSRQLPNVAYNTRHNVTRSLMNMLTRRSIVLRAPDGGAQCSVVEMDEAQDMTEDFV
jgi:hypothetical protein